MSERSGVEWCDSAVNPVMGCDGCELWMPERGVRHCYAGVMTERYRGLPGWPASFTEPKMFPGRMVKAAGWGDLRTTTRPDKPWLDGMPRVIFLSDMGDALSRSVNFTFLHGQIIQACCSTDGRRHLYLWLTKQPHRAVEFSNFLRAVHRPWPRNLGIGTSVTEMAYMPRVRHLAGVVGAPLRFLSIEPVVERIELEGEGIGWVATGGESGTEARPCNLADLRSIATQCQDAGVPVFVKQVGARPVDNEGRWDIDDPKGGNPDEWPVELCVRQMPRWSWNPMEGARWV